MKDFYYVSENADPRAADYCEQKRQTVLETIKPICAAFEITDYDYVNNDEQERLVIDGQAIGCSCNSIGATVRELINYIWIRSGCIDKVHNFQKAVENDLKRYWLPLRGGNNG